MRITGKFIFEKNDLFLFSKKPGIKKEGDLDYRLNKMFVTLLVWLQLFLQSVRFSSLIQFR